MDEAKKQKVMIGILVVAIGGILAFNFWPKGSPAALDDDEGPIARKVRRSTEEAPKAIQVQRTRQEETEEAAPARRRRMADEGTGATMRRPNAKAVDKDKVVPSF